MAALILAFAVCSPAQASDPPVAGTIDLARGTRPGSTAGGFDQRFIGRTPGGRAGQSVALAGDLNGDGRQDYAIGMPLAGQGGTVAIVYGSPAGGTTIFLPARAERGLRITGPAGARAGMSVAGLGDVNGDRIDDLLIGAPRAPVAGRGSPGAAYVVLGGPRPASGRLVLGTPGTGFRIAGVAHRDGTGATVASTADLDGDGARDAVIGAPDADGFGRPDAGGAFVVYSSALKADVDLAALQGAGYRIDGAAPGDDAAQALSATGDMNGDGLGEVVVGAPSASGNAGAVHVVFGRAPAAAKPIDLAGLGDDGFVAYGTPGERAGYAVAGVQDATGDGLPDVVVGAPLSSWNGRLRSGAAYVVPGRAGSGTSLLPAGGLRVGGGDAHEHLGAAVAAAGDVDGDGSADLLIGLAGESALARPAAGAVLVLRTGRAPRAGDLDGSLLGDTAMRLTGPIPGSGLGRALAGGVDVGGDGRPDALVGQPLRNDGRGGAALVLLPAPPSAPAPPARTGSVLATDIAVVIDDSGSMRRFDPDGALRRNALLRMLLDPAAQDRVLSAVEFGTKANQIIPPSRIGQDPFQGDRLRVLRGLLAERLRSNAGTSDVLAGLTAAAATNPDAQSRILLTDTATSPDLASFGGVRTDIVAIGAATRGGREPLERLAQASGGRFFPVTDGAGLQSALAAIDSALRGEPALPTAVADTEGVTEVQPAVAGEAAAEVSKPNAEVAFTAAAAPAKARRLQRARMVTTWNRRRSRIRLDRVRFRVGAAQVKASRRQIRRALRGRWQRLGRGVRIRGRRGRTFVSLSVSGLARPRGRRAEAAAGGFHAYTRFVTYRARHTIVRSRWTYQRRPT